MNIMSIGAYFSYSIKLKKSFNIKSNVVFLNINNLNYKNYTTDFYKMLDSIRLNDLINYYKNNDVRVLNEKNRTPILWEPEIHNLKQYFNNYQHALSSVVKDVFSKKVVKSVNILYPFLRISNVNYHIIFTFFTTITYIDDFTEIIITEQIPDGEYSENFEYMHKYTYEAMTKVRCSTFIYNKIYSYLTEEEINEKFNSYFINYILTCFIENNFNIAITDVVLEKSKLFIGIWGNIEGSNALKDNKKTKIYQEESVIYISINNGNFTYDQYMTELLKNIYSYNIISYLYDETLKLIERKDKSPIKMQQMILYCDYLKRMMWLDKINFSADISLLIRNYGNISKEVFEKRIYKLIEIAFKTGLEALQNPK